MASTVTRSTIISRHAVSLKPNFSKAFYVKALTKRSATPARTSLSVVAADRAMWFNGATAPAHLDGTMPGDFGFDPLGLGTNPDRLKWYQEAELQNGRWAMMAVAGILGTSALGVEPVWYEAGKADYALPTLALLSIQFPVMGMLETKRFEGFKATGMSGVMDTYPFDPAGMSSDSMKVKEVKNGRLAMVAFVGFMVQALVTRAGPLDNLSAHMANPAGVNITTTVANIPNVL